jgi:hypothetical protein
VDSPDRPGHDGFGACLTNSGADMP